MALLFGLSDVIFDRNYGTQLLSWRAVSGGIGAFAFRTPIFVNGFLSPLDIRAGASIFASLKLN